MQNAGPMMLMMCLISAGWLLSLASASGAASQSRSQTPSARELLDKYTQALDATQSLIEFYEEVRDESSEMPNGAAVSMAKRLARGQHRVDGQRIYSQNYYWGDFNPQLRNLPESNPRYELRIEADKRLYAHTNAINDPRARGSAYSQPAHREKAAIDVEKYSGIFGFLGADERLDTVLRGANRISLRPTTEMVNGSACHVIDADTKYGQYAVWLDPKHGYNAAKVTRKAVGGQKEVEDVMPAGDRVSGSVEITRFEQVGGVWVPVEADQDTAYTSGEFFRQSHSRYKRTKVTLNPDHDKLGSFDDPLLKNPANDPELKKNGTAVHITGPITVNGFWQDGRVVDESGKVIDIQRLLATTKLSLLNAPLPALADLSKGLSQVQASDKSLLVCLLDIEQRPSRQCLSDLAQKAAALSAKGVTIVVVQTSKVDLKQHESWMKAVRIDLPIHILEGDFEAQKGAWAAKALPWLILTDKNHVVRAEGFAVNELERNVKELEDAKP